MTVTIRVVVFSLVIASLAIAGDVGTLRVMAPFGTVDSGTVVTPQCSVYNFGGQTATFSIKIKIGVSYADSVSVNSLAPGSPYVASFLNWTANQVGVSIVSCSTRWASDTFAGNDRMTDSVRVRRPVVSHDIGVTAVLFPGDTFDTSQVVIPRARVRNFGDSSATFRTFFGIDNGSDARVYFDSALIAGLTPGDSATPTFAEWPKPHLIGNYTGRCSIHFALDTNRANDTLSRRFTVRAAAPPGETGWVQLASVPPGPKGKKVKDGGCQTYNRENDSDYVYLLKGNNTCEFYRYSISTNTWDTKESIPAVGLSGRKKRVKKGACLTQVDGRIYATKGNNTLDLWRYTPGTPGVWEQMADVPAGLKNLKEGTGAAGSKIFDTAWVYLLKGSRTNEFYRFGVLANTWQTMANAPLGISGAGYKYGSCLAYDWRDTTIYALKAVYNEFFAYGIRSDVWTTMRSLPFYGRENKKRKVGPGAGAAYYPGNGLASYPGVYALKGNNTREFWKYIVATDTWLQKTDLIAPDGKNVGGGGGIGWGGTSSDAPITVEIGKNTFGFIGHDPDIDSDTGKGGPGVQTHQGIARHQSASLLSPSEFLLDVGVPPLSGAIRVTIYDATGRAVGAKSYGYVRDGQHTIPIDARTLSRGVYLLRIEAADYRLTRKLILE